jgi:cytoskeletal protein CcmA (bactofilin family)
VFGSSLVLARQEVVNDLSVFGGSAELHGTVQGDVLVMGGSLTVHDGARVYGDVGVLGGSVELQNGARIDGDLSSAGGHIERASGAIVKGEETALGGSKSDKLSKRDADDDPDEGSDEHHEDHEDNAKEDSWSFASALDKLGSALSRSALLYAFGCILLASAGQPMERMRQELSERPVRALGLGAAALIGGFFAMIVLCVTIIGIPIAIMLFLVGALGVYAGMCAVFLELGALVLEERTDSPYVHLALGCLMYLVFSTLPVIGWIATALAVVCGLGLLVSTRFAGLIGRPPSQLTNPVST